MPKINQEDKIVFIKTAIIITIVALVFLAWVWWAKVYTSKGNVFNAMIANNLSSYGVSKSTTQENQGGTINQISQVQFGANNVADVRTDVNQVSGQGDVKVITQTLSTPDQDFVRYQEIDMPAPEGKAKIDFSSLIGQWGKTLRIEGGGASFFELTFGVVPHGNLSAQQRSELLDIIKSQNVYKTDFSKTEIKSENGRTVYIYKTEVNLKAYATLIKAYDKMMGINQMEQLNIEDYAEAPPVNVTLTVDKLSRKLVKLDYGDGRVESFSGFGVRNQVDLPKESVGRQELEANLQKLLGQAQQ